MGALLFLTEGVTPLLLNHSRRVGFPTTLCTLSRGRSLSRCTERWCQQINLPRIFSFRYIFLGKCTLQLITFSLRRLHPAHGTQDAFPMARTSAAAPRLAAADRRGGMVGWATAATSRRPTAHVEPNAARALVAGTAAADAVEPVEKVAAEV